jgi:hypothetical protein
LRSHPDVLQEVDLLQLPRLPALLVQQGAHDVKRRCASAPIPRVPAYYAEQEDFRI